MYTRNDEEWTVKEDLEPKGRATLSSFPSPVTQNTTNAAEEGCDHSDNHVDDKKRRVFHFGVGTVE